MGIGIHQCEQLLMLSGQGRWWQVLVVAASYYGYIRQQFRGVRSRLLMRWFVVQRHNEIRSGIISLEIEAARPTSNGQEGRW